MSSNISLDEQVVNELTQAMGSKPEFYLYVVQNPPLWVTILLAGGFLAAFLQKPYMVGFAKDKLTFIPTSMWSTSSLKPNEVFSISRNEIISVKWKKFLVANYFTLELRSGKKMRFVANTLYKKLAKQTEGIEGIKKALDA